MLTRLGVPKLWKNDPERFWAYGRPFMTGFLGRVAPSYSYGVERIPPTGGAVVAANHFGTVDPPLIGIHSTRTIYYMAKIELLEVPIAGELLRWTGAFAVRRGESDRDSIRLARWLVREGHLVGMFMEGTRQRFGYPGPAHPGAVMVAINEGVPIVPCGLDTFRWSLRNPRPCCIVWGEPISLDWLPRTGRGYKEGAMILEAQLTRLWRSAAEAVAASFPQQLPDGTPRSGPVPNERALPALGIRPWPQEEWAAGPLGPVFRANGERRSTRN
jgi:1-acyl-sn-glycerol-3-phosphate acyltransferase